MVAGPDWWRKTVQKKQGQALAVVPVVQINVIDGQQSFLSWRCYRRQWLASFCGHSHVLLVVP
jgi:hypothetical protein